MTIGDEFVRYRGNDAIHVLHVTKAVDESIDMRGRYVDRHEHGVAAAFGETAGDSRRRFYLFNRVANNDIHASGSAERLQH